MKIMLAMLSATTILAASNIAFADDETSSGSSKTHYKDNGGYETIQSSSQTSTAGTARSASTDVNVNVDSQGKTDKTVKVKSTEDPKGLMNKKANVTESEVKQKDNGGYDQTVSHTHTNAAGTNTSDKTTTDVSVDNNGNVTKEVKSKSTVDPKGLDNKQTTSSTVKSVNGHVTEQTSQNN